jgi:hypothetical protein
MPVEDERLGSKLQSTITPEFRFRAHLADKVEVELTVM